jgi:hypothetical protein
MNRSEIQVLSQFKKTVKARLWPGNYRIWLTTCPKCGSMLAFNRAVFFCLNTKTCNWEGWVDDKFMEEMKKYPDLTPSPDLKRLYSQQAKKEYAESKRKAQVKDAQRTELHSRPAL